MNSSKILFIDSADTIFGPSFDPEGGKNDGGSATSAGMNFDEIISDLTEQIQNPCADDEDIPEEWLAKEVVEATARRSMLLASSELDASIPSLTLDGTTFQTSGWTVRQVLNFIAEREANSQSRRRFWGVEDNGVAFFNDGSDDVA